MGLTHDELRDVLARAEAIQSASRSGEEMSVELEAVIAAAEEVGIARPSRKTGSSQSSRARVAVKLIGAGAVTRR